MALRDEGCAARAVIQQLDATAATKNEVQRISTIYVGGKQDTSDFAILRRVYMFDVDGCAVPRGGWFAAASEDQERGRLPSNRGIGGTGDPSFSGEHGPRVARGFISVLNAAKDDDRERVCSGVNVATRPAGEREKLRRRTKPCGTAAASASRQLALLLLELGLAPTGEAFGAPAA